MSVIEADELVVDRVIEETREVQNGDCFIERLNHARAAMERIKIFKMGGLLMKMYISEK